MNILLQDATLVTMDGRGAVRERQQLLIQGGKISWIGEQLKTDLAAIDQRIDCSGRIVLPGLINAHSHLVEILQRSFRDNVRKEVWIRKRQMTEEAAELSDNDIGAAAALACAEMLKSGVTAVVDHFSLRAGITTAKMKAVLGAFQRTGIRGMLAPSLRDQNFLDLISRRPSDRKPPSGNSRDFWQDEMMPVLELVRSAATKLGLMLGPSSPQNCSDRLLREIVRTAEENDLGIHTHLLETVIERWGGRKLYPKGIVHRINKLGLLSPRLSAAHGVWLDAPEMDLLAAAGASVVHNPASNLKLGSGIAPVAELKKRGVNVALGTDGGDTSDNYSIFEQMRLAAFLSRVNTRDPNHWVTAADALRMATINGAKAIPEWRGKIGAIRTGYRADLVILKPHLRLHPLNNVIHQLVYCEGGESVDTVLVDGEIVVRDGRLTWVDEDALIKAVAPISETMFRIYNRIKNRPDAADLEVETLYRKAVRPKTSRRGLAN
ncbi:MAG TPA: amidohydrolase [Candidatus Binatia bacterium]|jgi:cytosine/adenosine deaminase-related metal-dependent hydrolase|nr:amidohydrolase [Candidatus Binatia bacterium]